MIIAVLAIRFIILPIGFWLLIGIGILIFHTFIAEVLMSVGTILLIVGAIALMVNRNASWRLFGGALLCVFLSALLSF